MPSTSLPSHSLQLSPLQLSPVELGRRFSIAPMLDWTDRHARYFHRLLTEHSLLYTEMITTGALIHGDKKRFLTFNSEEHPVACQLGGNNPEDLAVCAQMVEDYGYDEINLNVGCPSDRVQNGAFGACLMKTPELVAEGVHAMQQRVKIPVTVKHRIGIDDQDDYEFVHHFVSTVSKAGCNTFIVHARKAILQGLSPKENREIPPLKYDVVYQLKEDFPQLNIVLNGGIKDLETAQLALQKVDGIMMGREAYQNPFLLADVDHRLLGSSPKSITRIDIAKQLIGYIESQVEKGIPVHRVAKHTLGLFHGQPGGKQFRRYLSENLYKRPLDTQVFKEALQLCTSYSDS